MSSGRVAWHSHWWNRNPLMRFCNHKSEGLVELRRAASTCDPWIERVIVDGDDWISQVFTLLAQRKAKQWREAINSNITDYMSKEGYVWEFPCKSQVSKENISFIPKNGEVPDIQLQYVSAYKQYEADNARMCTASNWLENTAKGDSPEKLVMLFSRPLCMLMYPKLAKGVDVPKRKKPFITEEDKKQAEVVKEGLIGFLLLFATTGVRGTTRSSGRSGKGRLAGPS